MTKNQLKATFLELLRSDEDFAEEVTAILSPYLEGRIITAKDTQEITFDPCCSKVEFLSDVNIALSDEANDDTRTQKALKCLKIAEKLLQQHWHTMSDTEKAGLKRSQFVDAGLSEANDHLLNAFTEMPTQFSEQEQECSRTIRYLERGLHCSRSQSLTGFEITNDVIQKGKDWHEGN
ncbi:hypothetical protein VCHA53O466_140128 [Vibrio chagasii]|nr:hypothetical protein VCHA53O466_140128 [Vibrio chagasii]